MNIILIGLKSCGKSTVGAALAQRLGMAFVDTDTLVEQLHTARGGAVLSFREIYRQHGKAYFLDLEQEVVSGLADLAGHVIAAGGGTFINHEVPPLLRQRAHLVYLHVPVQVLSARIAAGGTPAFFGSNDITTEVERLFAERHPHYLQQANLSIAADAPVDALVEEIIARLALGEPGE